MAKKELKFEEIAQRIAKSLETDDSKTIVDWIIKHNIKTEDNLPYSFENRKYLIDIVNDLNPRQAIPSSAQVGKTVLMYIKALKMCMEGMNVCFSEPTQDLSDMLVKSKLNRIIDNNPVLKQMVSAGNLQSKNVGDRMMYLVYTFGSLNVGFSSDLNIYDEVERSNPDTINLLKGRTLNSEYKWEWFISNPTVPDSMLDRLWKSEYCDQKHWTITCHHCQQRQILNYDGLYGMKGNVCKERQIFVCQHCDNELSMEDRTNGEWVPRYPSRRNHPNYVSGYWLHQLMRHNVSVPELLMEEKKDKMAFYNMYLGMPYSGSDVSASKEVILENVVEPVLLERNVTMGIDTGYGTGHHYVIGSDHTAFKMGTAKDFDEIELLMKQYQVQQVVIDNGPETENANKLAEKYPGKVLKNYYNSHLDKEEVQYKEETSMVYSARHRVFDRIIRDINQGTYKFAFDLKDPIIHKFGDHFGTMSCVVVQDKKGNFSLRWAAPEHASDHFAHAFLYWRLAVERYKYRSPQYMPYTQEEIRTKIAVQQMDQWLPKSNDEEDLDWYNL